MKTWITSDHHFGHQGMCEFSNHDGTKTRPWTDHKDADRIMIEKWNDIVKPDDKVYHLGDVAFHNRYLEIMEILHGRKVLIKGNHDRLKPRAYLKYFKDIRGSHVLDHILLTHIPVHPGSKARFRGNIHGHVHGNTVRLENLHPDPWYFNACVEATDYAPVLFDKVRDLLFKKNPPKERKDAK